MHPYPKISRAPPWDMFRPEHYLAIYWTSSHEFKSVYVIEKYLSRQEEKLNYIFKWPCNVLFSVIKTNEIPNHFTFAAKDIFIIKTDHW